SEATSPPATTFKAHQLDPRFSCRGLRNAPDPEAPASPSNHASKCHSATTRLNGTLICPTPPLKLRGPQGGPERSGGPTEEPRQLQAAVGQPYGGHVRPMRLLMVLRSASSRSGNGWRHWR